MTTYKTRMKKAERLSIGYWIVFAFWAWWRNLPETALVVILCAAAAMTMVVYASDAVYMALSERLDDIKNPSRIRDAT